VRQYCFASDAEFVCPEGRPYWKAIIAKQLRGKSVEANGIRTG
jgi:hypothetical protein